MAISCDSLTSMSCRDPVAGFTAQPSATALTRSGKARETSMAPKIDGTRRVASTPQWSASYAAEHAGLLVAATRRNLAMTANLAAGPPVVLIAGAALPSLAGELGDHRYAIAHAQTGGLAVEWADRKSTRLNSSHDQISYAVFCLKK